jgi:hypothetical protein
MPLIQELVKLYHIATRRSASLRPLFRTSCWPQPAAGSSDPHGDGCRSHSLLWRLIHLGVVGLLAGCAGLSLQGVDNSNPEKSYIRQLSDMPLPRGSRIVTDGTLILGGGADWTGRLAIVTDLGGVETFAFFRDQYPNQGWTLISSLQARNSILIFVKGARTATVEISSSSLFGLKSNVLMTVAPKVDEGRANNAAK